MMEQSRDCSSSRLKAPFSALEENCITPPASPLLIRCNEDGRGSVGMSMWALRLVCRSLTFASRPTESRVKYFSPDNQGLKASSLSQALKIHAGRLSANVLSPIRTDL
ncbi:hypothetical protein TURU_117352 [Turdus rufiventris]|nr:hypothetical protein TURU_117352 [Turdus rufiventris]